MYVPGTCSSVEHCRRKQQTGGASLLAVQAISGGVSVAGDRLKTLESYLIDFALTAVDMPSSNYTKILPVRLPKKVAQASLQASVVYLTITKSAVRASATRNMVSPLNKNGEKMS